MTKYRIVFYNIAIKSRPYRVQYKLPFWPVWETIGNDYETLEEAEEAVRNAQNDFPKPVVVKEFG